MKSLLELFRIGHGPSASHTLAPARAAATFRKDQPRAAAFHVSLYGSLAATGKGHLTDRAITESFHPHPVTFDWHPDQTRPEHPNAMRFEALDAEGHMLAAREEFSVGGGALLSDRAGPEVYPFESMEAMLNHCRDQGVALWEIVQEREGDRIGPHLAAAWQAMRRNVRRGLHTSGTLPGGLRLERKAQSLHRKSRMLEPACRDEALLAAYACAVAEESAAGGETVTAPTCGSSGVLPAVLYHLQTGLHLSEPDVLHALATAGVFGNVVKTNGSISGAEVGCQGEVGTACAMAAAAAAQLYGGSPRQIEYAAEMGLEHHFGLTCDPVAGLVQIPCIERNAHAALRAVSCARFAMLSDGRHHISFDDAVSVLLETGRNLSILYRETATGGLARVYQARFFPHTTQ